MSLMDPQLKIMSYSIIGYLTKSKRIGDASLYIKKRLEKEISKDMIGMKIIVLSVFLL